MLDMEILPKLRTAPPAPLVDVGLFFTDGTWMPARWSGKSWRTNANGPIGKRLKLRGWIPLEEAREVARLRREDHERKTAESEAHA